MNLQHFPQGIGEEIHKIGNVQVVYEGETRFLERKLCKELYSVAAGWFG